MRRCQDVDRVRVHFVLRFQDGTVRSSRAAGVPPLEVTVGVDHRLLPGLGQGLFGLTEGQVVALDVPPERAFGLPDPDRIKRVTRARFADEQTRLAGELMRGTLDASQRAHELVDSMRELARRTEETNTLRVEVAGLRAELERARSAATALPAPPELIDQDARRLYGEALESLCFEVRRALNAVLGYSRLPLYDAESGQQQDDVRALEVAGERLLVFVNDLHDLSRAEANALVLEPEAVDVESALRQAAVDAAERLQRKLSDFLVAA